MNNLSILFLYALTAISFFSCEYASSVKGIYNKDVKVQKCLFGEKSVIFLPIVHFGQKEFYSNLKDSILTFKSSGYTVFYEEIHHSNLDSAALHLYNMKWRKINGGMSSTRETYDELSETFEDKIVQPPYYQLGIDELDQNADIGLDELIHKYEGLYGGVKIDSCDKATPLASNYRCGEKFKHDLEPVILTFRNEQLANKIWSSVLDKIVVVYGKDHVEGVIELLEAKHLLNEESP